MAAGRGAVRWPRSVPAWSHDSDGPASIRGPGPPARRRSSEAGLLLGTLSQQPQQERSGPTGLAAAVVVGTVSRPPERTSGESFGPVWFLVLRHLREVLLLLPWLASVRTHRPMMVDGPRDRGHGPGPGPAANPPWRSRSPAMVVLPVRPQLEVQGGTGDDQDLLQTLGGLEGGRLRVLAGGLDLDRNLALREG